jgi:uncharacterized membrane protein
MHGHILTVLTFMNSVLWTGALVLMFARFPHGEGSGWFVYVLFSVVLLNSVLFFYYTRHRRLNARLTDAQKNKWEIAMFFASPVSFPLYFFRYVRRTHDAA